MLNHFEIEKTKLIPLMGNHTVKVINPRFNNPFASSPKIQVYMWEANTPEGDITIIYPTHNYNKFICMACNTEIVITVNPTTNKLENAQPKNSHRFNNTTKQLETCPHPNGKTTEIEIPTPSGEIIITNDFRPEANKIGIQCDYPDETLYTDTGEIIKNIQDIQHFQKNYSIGLVPTTNTTISIHRTPNNEYLFSDLDENDRQYWLTNPTGDEDINAAMKTSPELANPKIEYLGAIICNLWAIMLGDRDTLSQTISFDPNNTKQEYKTIPVPTNSTQILRINSTELDFDRWNYNENPTYNIYARLKTKEN